MLQFERSETLPGLPKASFCTSSSHLRFFQNKYYPQSKGIEDTFWDYGIRMGNLPDMLVEAGDLDYIHVYACDLPSPQLPSHKSFPTALSVHICLSGCDHAPKLHPLWM